MPIGYLNDIIIYYSVSYGNIFHNGHDLTLAIFSKPTFAIPG
jgi:hypothetical protein